MMKSAWKSLGWGCGLIVVLTIAAYLPTLRCGFIWEDAEYVTQNQLLTAPDGLKRIWFSTHNQSQYFPLVYTTLRFERKLWGLSPVGYHLVNVLLHGVNALLVWEVLRRLAVPGAWLAAAIWAVHPVNVESVAWITELKNTQSTLFYLLALLAWMKFADGDTVHPWRFYALALFLHALALFSKTTACTLPAPMLLVLWLRKDPIGWRRFVQVVPFVCLGLAMGLLSLWWEHHLGNYGEEVRFSYSGLERLLIAARALWFYATKLVWPVKLTVSYPHWEISQHDPLQYIWLIGCVAVGLLLWWRRKTVGRGPVAAVAFFVAALSPLLGFIPVYTFRYSFVADRYQYAASIGLITLFAAAVSSHADRWQVGHNRRWALSVPLLIVLGAMTWQQAGIYQDAEMLWRDTVKKNPNAWIAHNNLGNVLKSQGKVPEAIEHYEQALRIKPDSAEAHNNLGIALQNLGKVPEAIGHYEQALRLKPDYADVHYNLGVALFQLGRVQEAARQYEQAVQARPDHAQARWNLGVALFQLGDVGEAIAQWEQVLQANPEFADAHYNLGVALFQLGRVQEAIGHWEQALRVRPDYAEAHYNLGIALERTGQLEDAIGHYEQVLRIRPDFPDAQNKLTRLRAGQ
jgi:tetratricopeptide (TPR) repeat protein